MPDIEIKLTGVQEATQRLEGIPGGVRTALNLAIRHTLKFGRTRIAKEVQARYEVPSYGWLLKAIGSPHMQGPMGGFLRVSGTRLKLSDLPHWREIFPFGIAAQERVVGQGLPANLIHAFARGGKIFERTGGAGSSAYPIFQPRGSSVPAMAGEAHVMGEIKEKMDDFLAKDLQTMIKLVLDGTIPGR